VTGTLISGTVRKEQEVEIHPLGRRTRVRNVQVHGASAEKALAGQRTALNLANIAVEEMARGMVLTAAEQFLPTRRVDVKLELLSGAPPLKNHARVHFHAHSAETIAAVALHPSFSEGGAEKQSSQLASGASSYAQLRLAGPQLLLPGDRFIVRQFSPLVTIGGGVVLDAEPVTRMGVKERSQFLQLLESGSPAEILEARIARRRLRGLTQRAAIAETGWTPEQLARAAKELLAAKLIVQFGDALLTASAVQQIESTLLAAANRFHDENRLVAGISKEELRERADLDAEVFLGAMERLASAKKLVVAGEIVQVAGRGVQMKSDESESKRMIEEAFANAGLQVPALKDVLAGVKLDRGRAQQVVTLLLRDKVLFKLADELVFHHSALEQLRKSVGAAKAQSPKIDVARFKELTGLSRKYAIPLLEYLDRERVTKRVGDERVIL
jgi:selenocysteine-specific elongation factor